MSNNSGSPHGMYLKHYKVVLLYRQVNPTKFENLISEYINRGYIPCGSLSIAFDSGHFANLPTYSQAMCLWVKENTSSSENS